MTENVPNRSENEDLIEETKGESTDSALKEKPAETVVKTEPPKPVKKQVDRRSFSPGWGLPGSLLQRQRLVWLEQ